MRREKKKILRSLTLIFEYMVMIIKESKGLFGISIEELMDLL